MTRSSPPTADHWAVSTRTQGGVLSAVASLPSIEMALLGIPQGFTPGEIQSWLRDLAGVAIETSRNDSQSRPIPQLLHHVLTGLLFSQTELWSHTGQPLPCAAVFVETPHGVAFGWVGKARVVLLANGEPFEPQWVIVRDEAGQEAMSATLPRGAHALLTLEYWPRGEDGKQAPASVDAEWGQSLASMYPVGPLPGARPAQPVTGPAPGADAGAHVTHAGSGSPRATPAATTSANAHKPAALPLEQPGLAPDRSRHGALDQPDASQSLPSTYHPSASTFAMPSVPSRTPSPPADAASDENLLNEADRPEGEDGGDGHPVSRWLTKLLSFGRKPETGPAAREAQRARQAPPEAGERITRAEADASERIVSSIRDDEPPALGERMPGAPEPWYASAQSEAVDPDEPHTLPQDPARQPRSASPDARTPSSGPFAPVGLKDILGPNVAGQKPAGASPPPAQTPGPPQKLEGLTAVSGPSGPYRPPTRDKLSPDPATQGRPPYPMLDVGPLPPKARKPMEIEREPVGADATFAIPRLPSREPPRPFKVAVPTAADSLAPPAGGNAGAAASRTGPPVASPPVEAARDRASGKPSVPEPPAEFLAEFAASSEEAAPIVLPDQGPGIVTVSPGPVRAPEPPAQQHWPPPALPSVRRAVAVSPPVPPLPPPSEAPDVESEPEPEAPPPEPPVLRAPTEEAPVAVAESELPSILRELPLPAVDEGVDEDGIPDGVLVARPALGPRVRRSTWPEMEDERPSRTPFWRNPWLLGLFITVFAGAGWLLAHSMAPDNDVQSTPMSRLLRTVGLGGSRFTATVETDPPGAFISLDGTDLGRRTPAVIELKPGEHKLTLSLADLGGVEVAVKGTGGQKVKVSESLHGSLEVTAVDKSLPVKMSLDGEAKGFLPVIVEKLPPGLHELQFTGPGMQPWAQNVNVPIRETMKVKAKPMVSPATGFVQVQATISDEGGTQALEGAFVHVDGEFRGSTPITLELPRGPHSLKVVYLGVPAPIQVIDLPGGNKRFAMFQFGLDSDLPPLKLKQLYGLFPAGQETLIEASLDGLDWHELREAWLHVRTSEGIWRRYQVTVEEGPKGTLLSVHFPAQIPGTTGRIFWYMSAATTQGDEFFTEMQRSNRPG